MARLNLSKNWDEIFKKSYAKVIRRCSLYWLVKLHAEQKLADAVESTTLECYSAQLSVLQYLISGPVIVQSITLLRHKSTFIHNTIRNNYIQGGPKK